MKLVEVEIQGFKSFQSKFNFKLDNNLIGIVGPNGSGKSNIIDSIRWALGEQSAKNLRGSNMQDIIFSGTAEKKGKNFAEVTLVFKDKDNKRSISRKLYRNGDSEYTIDGKKSRLKEITDLYLDFGISRESYSIITQGKVENIISSKPTDRRIIIEEAAGVLKYKNKRKETYDKLDKTTENINRLNDIFSEIKTRNDVLFEQSNKARKYLEYEKELKEKDILVKVYNIKNFSCVLEELNLKKNSLLLEKKSLSENLLSLDNKIKEIKNKIFNLDTEFNEKKDYEIQVIKEKEKLQYNINIFKERNVNKEQSILKLNKEIKKNLEKKLYFEDKITLLNKEIFDLDKNVKNISDEINILLGNDNLSSDNIEKEIDKLKEVYLELIKKEVNLQNELELLSLEKNNNESNISFIKENFENLNASIENNIANLKNKNIIKDNLLKEINLANKNIDNLNLQLNKLSQKRKNIIDKIFSGKELFNKYLNKREFLENQNSSFNYYNLGVKEILLNKNKFSGVYSTVAEILKFDKDYAISLDTALAHSQQNIIVENSDVARKCVDILKKSSKGRATFLPLDNIKPRDIDLFTRDKIKSLEGFISIASNLVSYDSKYMNIISYLLGNVIIVDNLKNGNKIASAINFKYRIVTLDGQVINSGGSITGGTQYNNNSVIKNKAEIEEIKDNITKIENKLTSLDENLSNIDKNIIKLEKEKTNFKNDMQNNLLKEKEISFEIIRLEENISKDKEELKIEKDKLNIFQCNSNLEKEEKILKDLEALRAELNSIKQEIEKNNELKLTLKDKDVKRREFITEKSVQKSKFLEALKHTKNILKEYEKNLGEVNSSLEKLKEELGYFSDENFLSEEKIEELEEKNKNLEEELKEIEKLINKLIIEKDNYYKDEQTFSENQKEANNFLLEVNSQLEKLNLEINKNEFKIDDELNYLLEKYETTYENEQNNLENYSVSEISDFRNITKSLRKKISELGYVNVDSIEEYKEVNERYLFYKKEIDDLILSKKQLENTIIEIDKEVKQRFISTFNQIENNFDRIFKSLFGGGFAKITLENSADILNSGINIEVSPPGKKLQKLSLLSGGEKSLTAISLLFSILEIKNSPFVILDEVEAALDEDNVLKFADFLKHYAVNNQFLVITHRRGTMEAMSKLYGVTMQQKGISNVIPLELDNILKEEYISE